MANQIKFKVGFDVDKTSLNQLRSSLQQMQNLNYGDLIKINKSTLPEAKSALTEIRNQAGRVEDALKAAFNPKLGTVNIEKFNSILNSTGKPLNEVYATFKKAGAAGEIAFRNLSSQLLKVKTQVKETSTLFNKMATTFANTVKWNISSAAFNTMTNSVQQAWNFTKALDSSLNDIRIVTGKSADEMADFAIKANEAARALGESTKDYTNASLIFAQQGLSDEQIEARTAITLKTANVTGQTAEKASEQLTAVWNSYRVSAEEAEIYVDRLAAIAAKSASNLEELSAGMSKVASAAATMGVTEEQLASQLSTIISVTRQAPQTVGTALKTVYARITDIQAGLDSETSLGNYSGKMAEFGINVLDANNKLRDMGEVIEEIGGKWGTMTREQQIALAQTMGGQRQYSNLVALFDSFDKYNDMMQVAANAQGTLQKQQDIYMQRTTTHLQQLSTASQKLFMTLTDDEAFKGIIDSLTGLITLTEKWVDSIGGLGSLLPMLGGLGLKTFSRDIAESIYRASNNFKTGRQEIDPYAQKLKEVQSELENQNLDESTREWLELQEKYFQSASRMPEAEKKKNEELIADIEKGKNALTELEEKISLVEQTFSKLTEKEGLSIKQIIEDPAIIEKYKDQLQSLKEAYANFYKEIKNAREKFDSDIQKAKKSQNDKERKSARVDIAKTAREFEGQLQEMLSKKVSPRYEQAIKNAQKQLDSLKKSGQGSWKGKFVGADFESDEAIQKLNSILAEFQKRTEIAKKEIAEEIKQVLEQGTQGFEEAVNKRKQIAGQVEQKQEEASFNIDRQNNINFIEDLTTMTGGLAQVYSGMSQIANLGNIWADSETFGQGFLKTITALSVAIPSLTTGFSAVQKGLKALEAGAASAIIKTKMLGLSTQQAKAFSISTAIKTKILGISYQEMAFKAKTAGVSIQTVANNQLVASMGSLTLKGGIDLLKTSFKGLLAALGPINIAFIALGAIMAIVQYQNKKLEESIENSKKEIEQQNKVQEQANKNRETLKSVQELNEQYKAGEITRAELKSSIQDLLKQYNAEDEIVKTLTKDYGSLEEAIQKQSRKEIESQKESAEIELGAAEDALLNTARQGKGYKYIDDYVVQFEEGLSGIDEPQQLRNALKQVQRDVNVVDRKIDGEVFQVDFDPQSITNLYDRLSEVRKQMATQMTAEERNESEYYKQMVEWLERMQPVVEQYKAALKDINTYSVELAAIDSKLDFKGIDNAVDYLAKKKAFIETLQKSEKQGGLGKTLEQAESLADVYFQQNYADKFFQFEEAGKAIDLYSEKFKENKKEIGELISKLDENQVSALLEINPDTIASWEQLKTIIQDFAQTDFSNIKDPFTGYSTENLEAASAQYNKYNTLYKQIQDGKSISTKEMQGLDQSLKSMFQRNANGTWQMTEDFKTFEKQVNNLQFGGFRDTLDGINAELDALEKVKNLGQDFYKKIDQKATIKPLSMEQMKLPFDQQKELIQQRQQETDALIQQQLKYLEATAAPNSVIAEQVELWKAMSPQQLRSKENVEGIYEALGKVGDKTVNAEERAAQLEKLYGETAKKMAKAMFPTDSDIDTKALSSLTDILQNSAKESRQLADGLKDDRDAAEDVAESILRFDDAIKDVVKNYKNWKAALESGSYQDLAKVLPKLRDAYADLLDLDGSSLSEDFLSNANNLELMKKAINGNADAYNQLQELAGQDIAIQVGLNKEQFDADKALIYQSIQEMTGAKFDDIQVGASLNDEGFLEGLSNMVNSAHMTAQQATDYLAAMGVDAEVVENKQVEKTTSQYTSAIPEVTTEYVDGTNPIDPQHSSVRYAIPTIRYRGEPVIVEGTQENAAFSLKVTSAKKSSGGGFKFKQSTHGAGSGKGTRTGKGSGKKGGGSKADTSQKDLKKPLEDERDIYHDINIELEQINRELDRTQKTQDRLYGKPLLNNLNKQSQILENHKIKLKEKQKIQEQDLVNQRSILKSLGVTFDAYNNIANYMDILAQKQNNINKLTEEYNKLVESYNASTNKDTKTKINEKIEAKNKEIQEAEEARKNLEDKIKNYDDLREAMEDLVDEIEDETQQQIEIAITKFRMQLEIRLDMGQAERDWNEFRRKVINNTNILKDSDFDQLFKDAKTNVEDLLSYFDVRDSQGSIAQLTEQLAATRGEIEAIDKAGESAIYGDNKAQAMGDLHSDLDELMGQMESIQDLIDEIDQAYLDTIDDIKDQFDEQIEGYELVADMIEHDMDLLTLLYGDKNYDAMSRYYDTLQANQNNQLDSLKQQRDYWRVQWEEAVARGDIQAAQKLKENYTNVLKDLNSLIEESAQTLQDKYTNAIEKIFNELDKKISGGKGVDYLELEWELMNKNADEYLDTINSAFKLQNLQTKFTKALNDTKSLKGQKEIKKLMDEQLNNLKVKDKLTEYDVQRAEKLLQIEQARIALEDAQSAKTTMRLKRDSQGNYSYQFVANDDDILEAQQNLANAQNDLYNFDKERYQANLNDMISAWKDFQNQYKEIQLDTSLTEEERVRKLALLREEYGQYINNKVAENEAIRGNLMDSAFTDYAALYDMDVENYQGMSDKEKNILMNDLVPAWDSGVQHMVDTFAGEGGFAKVCEEAFKHLDEVAKTYTNNLSELFSNAGINADALKEGTDNLIEGLSDLVEKNDDLIDRMKTELSAIEGLRNGAKDLMAQYNGVYEAAKKMTSAIHEYYQEQQKQAAEAAKKEATTKPTTPTTSSNIATKTTTSTAATAKTTVVNSVSSSSSGSGSSGGSSSKGNTGKIKGTKGGQGDTVKDTSIDSAYEEVKRLYNLIVSGKNSCNPGMSITAIESILSSAIKNKSKLDAKVSIVKKQNKSSAQSLKTKAQKAIDYISNYIKQRTSSSNTGKTTAIVVARKNYAVRDASGAPIVETYIMKNPPQLKAPAKSSTKVKGVPFTNPSKKSEPNELKKKLGILGFNTGGYTGDWSDDGGRLAVLHKKELILNASDTENMLSMVNITREILKNLNNNAFTRTLNISNLTPRNENNNDTIEQNVRIEASFPNVDSKREIEEAFNDLVNLAAQRAMKR